MELKEKIELKFNEFWSQNSTYQGLLYYISEKGNITLDDVRIHGCYSSVGSTYQRFQSNNDSAVKRAPKRIGIVLKNHMRSERPAYSQGTKLLVKELTDPNYSGRFKEYIDAAAAEFKLTLPQLATFMLETGLIIPTGFFAMKPKLEVMSFMMAFRETYSLYGSALTLSNLYPITTFKEWLVYSLMGYNLSSYFGYKKLFRGHGTFAPVQKYKQVYNFFFGTNTIKYPVNQYTKPYSESHYWDNGGTVVYNYIGNNDLCDDYWKDMLEPLKEFVRKDYRNPDGLHPQYWSGITNPETPHDGDKVKEIRNKFKTTLKGIVDKCVESLE